MTPDELKGAWGRKVFFLYPHSVFNEDMLLEILDNEYEVYVIKSHVTAWNVAKKFPGSILFINIDSTLSEKEWEGWVRKLIEDPERATTKIGILTYNVDQELARKYLMEITVPCGFIQLKQGLVESKRIILKTLEANEAKGRRRYVRARCMDPKKATFNMKHVGKIYNGVIKDISAAGMAFALDKQMALKQGALLDDIQLKLKGILCRVSGTFVGEIREGPTRNLLMFSQPMHTDTKDKIHRFIFHSLQEEMEALATAVEAPK